MFRLLSLGSLFCAAARRVVQLRASPSPPVMQVPCHKPDCVCVDNALHSASAVEIGSCDDPADVPASRFSQACMPFKHEVRVKCANPAPNAQKSSRRVCVGDPDWARPLHRPGKPSALGPDNICQGALRPIARLLQVAGLVGFAQDDRFRDIPRHRPVRMPIVSPAADGGFEMRGCVGALSGWIRAVPVVAIRPAQASRFDERPYRTDDRYQADEDPKP